MRKLRRVNGELRISREKRAVKDFEISQQQLSWLNPLLEGGLVQEGRVSLLLAGLLPYYALFLNFTFLLKASTFWHFGTVKVYSPNIFLSYIKKI